ncbi:hypothetical protein EV401DRAFT_739653 [Pisolithus croceorrhizus]|nr:hypothetical protein EV401DRAFT_739653 [Pisolithus croceorrhizus]
MIDVVWRPGGQKPRPSLLEGDVYRPDILEIIEKTIDELSPALRELSQDILGTSLSLAAPTQIRCLHPLYFLFHSSPRTEVRRKTRSRCIHGIRRETGLRDSKTLLVRNCLGCDVHTWARRSCSRRQL